MSKITTLSAIDDGDAPGVTGDPGVSGMELPEFLPESTGPQAVARTFAFLDLCGFTAFTEAQGPNEAVDLFGDFRTCVRQLAARRGVRIAKRRPAGVAVAPPVPSSCSRRAWRWPPR